uniref:Superoxide dismutase copper/zinc binding domain-containing protein n=1 Tax=Strigamia maritima TaxID=126957 RepID=T1IQZ2_STRMM
MAINAVCIFMGNLIGSLIFLQQQTHDGVVHVTGQIRNLSEGEHGFHIHKSGDLRNGCMNANSHYNPFNKTHGASEDEEKHVGDLGNMFVESNGVAVLDAKFEHVTLHGHYSVIGRSVVNEMQSYIIKELDKNTKTKAIEGK